MVEIRVHKSLDGFMGTMNVPDELKGTSSSTTQLPYPIVILDRSGSMGRSVPRLVNHILPDALCRLGYKDEDFMHLITFDSFVEVLPRQVKALRRINIKARGQTKMFHTILSLIRVIDFVKCPRVRLLTISDGDLQDQEETVFNASKHVLQIQSKCAIASRAIRFFTSSSEPDTRGLASVLQFDSTCTSAPLLDLSADLEDDVLVSEIAWLFEHDGMSTSLNLIAPKAIIKRDPWSHPTTSCPVFPKSNAVWFSELPRYLKIEGIEEAISICVVYEKPETVTDLLKSRMDRYAARIKVLKVVDSKEAIDEIKEMMNYFQKAENLLMSRLGDDLDSLLANQTLKSRINYFREIANRRQKSFYSRLSEIANDDRVKALNSAQRAEYLRSTDITKLSKGLARRAVASGLDFDTTVRQESRAMHAHLHELKDVDDSKLVESFYSQDTTLGGIKAVCELVDMNLINDLDATEILQTINIVGIACDANIGDYPDPMTWRVDGIYPGCFVSLSDVLVAFIQSKGSDLSTPGTGHKIKNVIPYFDDVRILKFLRKHAPNILEYTCSIGMRRMIAGIPMTLNYTVVAGIWKLVEVLNTDKSEVNIMAFTTLVHSFEISVGKHFDFVLDFVTEQDPELSYYIANNGLTNMIAPMLKILRSDSKKFLPRILRSIYAFEVYQAVNRQFKSQQGSDELIRTRLHQLLGIDLNKVVFEFPSFFEEVKEPVFSGKFDPDKATFKKMSKTFRYLDFLVLLPDFLQAAFAENPVAAFRKIPSLTPDKIQEAMDFKMEVNAFKLYNIVQSLLYNDKKSRVDDDKKCMRITEVVQGLGKKMVSDYVMSEHRAWYGKQLAQFRKAEMKAAVDILISKLLSVESTHEFKKLLSSGLTLGTIHVQISNTYSLGFPELKSALSDEKSDIPLQTEKIGIFLLGRDLADPDVPVWNAGNSVQCALYPFQKVFEKHGEGRAWTHFDRMHEKFMIHTYRSEILNRHGHGNEKPSFAAMGYGSIEQFISRVDKAIWEKYVQDHPDCCGVGKILGTPKPPKKKKKKASH